MTIQITNNLSGFLDRSGIAKVLQVKRDFVNTARSFTKQVKANREERGERFTALMMKVAIFKLSAAAVTLVVMATLFLTRIHLFAPITAQFSKWVTSPLIGFILFVIVLKFAAISTGIYLTVLSAKEMTGLEARLWIRTTVKRKLQLLFRRKMSLQRAAVTPSSSR
ncbi:MAG: hypothetical protein MRK01_06495 [Candidatus Scalindua sp.]|nr:hypothetical protein [Candidatus Scalindua sp.]